MIYLALSIAASTSILILFRLIEGRTINTRHVITLSYFFSAALGFVFFAPPLDTIFTPWFMPAAVEGAVFYLVFRAMALTVQKNGVAIAGIATKMSVVIPVSIGLLVLNEEAGAIKLAGVVLGLCAVLLTVGRGGQIQSWKWPLLTFFGTGLIDASFKLFQVWSLTEQQFPGFLVTVFSFAFLAGSLHHLCIAEPRVTVNSIGCSTVLGCLNFATIYFLLKVLALPGYESSVVFPVNNFAVVALSALSGVLLFRERLGRSGWSGLGLSVISIGLLYAGI